MSERLEELCTRNGDLSELTLFRYLNDELDGEALGLVEQRLAESTSDMARLDELRTFAEGVSLTPPARPSAEGGEVVDGGWSRPTKIVAAIVAVAAVFALAFAGSRLLDGAGGADEGPIARVEPDADTIRTKGSVFDLRVQVERDSTQWLDDEDVVAPGETVQFVAYPRQEGYLLVVGIDASGAVYPCHPNGGGSAVEVEPVARELLLEGGLTFDEVLGTEHIIGLFCPQPFSFHDVEAAGLESLAQDWMPSRDCRRTDLRLVKESR